ncbi:UDP-2,4-diacetamido-2,4,6-trideoxy-beta-L-altropyranose hydrolase [Vibrio sp. NTOU-M3]|uniref:UDP-2,4-diacetamido-2,4, 6-trideoxy-beta-L-altropyranose hydrolase n=1 Tax=Vibrio sp. NTOU-M3 TaxID=3234954 RepID=UPI00349F3C02
MKVIFRTDASRLIGSGHVMRCLVLAEVLYSHGWEVQFACIPQDGDLIHFIEKKGFTVIHLSPPLEFKKPKFDGDYESWLPCSESEDALEFVKAVGCTDWVVVDHYGLDSLWEKQVRGSLCCHLFAIDDLNRKHDCNLILDQNLWPELQSRYSSCSARKLLGPEYALLRPRFKELKLIAPEKENQIIAFFGGADPTQECEKLLAASSTLVNLPFKIIVVTGRLNSKHDELLKYAEIEHIEVVQFLYDFEFELAKSKYAIGASGVSNWERFCLNIPATIVSVADNQVVLSQYLYKQKLVSYLGSGKETTSDLYRKELTSLKQQWDDICPYKHLSIDGCGANKVVKIMESY